LIGAGDDGDLALENLSIVFRLNSRGRSHRYVFQPAIRGEVAKKNGPLKMVIRAMP